MKKILFVGFLTSVALLSACTSSNLKGKSPEKIDDLKHICIKDQIAPKIPNFAQLVAENLQQRGITTDIQTEIAKDCRYALGYSVKDNGAGLIASAKLRLSLMNADSRKNLGEASYWYRGEVEKARVAQVGLKGQVDALVNELLKHN